MNSLFERAGTIRCMRKTRSLDLRPPSVPGAFPRRWSDTRRRARGDLVKCTCSFKGHCWSFGCEDEVSDLVYGDVDARSRKKSRESALGVDAGRRRVRDEPGAEVSKAEPRDGSVSCAPLCSSDSIPTRANMSLRECSAVNRRSSDEQGTPATPSVLG